MCGVCEQFSGLTQPSGSGTKADLWLAWSTSGVGSGKTGSDAFVTGRVWPQPNGLNREANDTRRKVTDWGNRRCPGFGEHDEVRERAERRAGKIGRRARDPRL